MRIIVLAEGATERAARSKLKQFLDQKADNQPRVGLEVKAFDGGLREGDVRTRSEMYLKDAEVCGVVALTDVYPKFASAAIAKCCFSVCLRPQFSDCLIPLRA